MIFLTEKQCNEKAIREIAQQYGLFTESKTVDAEVYNLTVEKEGEKLYPCLIQVKK